MVCRKGRSREAQKSNFETSGHSRGSQVVYENGKATAKSGWTMSRNVRSREAQISNLEIFRRLRGPQGVYGGGRVMVKSEGKEPEQHGLCEAIACSGGPKTREREVDGGGYWLRRI